MDLLYPLRALGPDTAVEITVVIMYAQKNRLHRKGQVYTLYVASVC